MSTYSGCWVRRRQVDAVCGSKKSAKADSNLSIAGVVHLLAWACLNLHPRSFLLRDRKVGIVFLGISRYKSIISRIKSTFTTYLGALWWNRTKQADE